MVGSVVLGVLGPILSCLTSSALTTLVSYSNNRRRERNDLVDHLRMLISTLSEVAAAKTKIDDYLTNSVSLQMSEEYSNVENNITDILTKCTAFIDKYNNIIGNQASSTTEPADPLRAMIVELKNLKSKMPLELMNMKWKSNLWKNLKLAKRSRDISKYIKLAVDVRERLKEGHMTMESNILNWEELNEDANALSVFDNYATEVVDLLRGEGKSIVGIHGLPGVGKTIVLRKVHNKLKESKVIWINYPEKMEEKEKILLYLQVEIMKQLGGYKESMNTSLYEKNISSFLKNKKYLLIMDNVSRSVDLGALGLIKNDDMKVVFASIDEKIVNSMTDQCIQIQTLQEEDAWKLFEMGCGPILECNKATAKSIIKCSGRIPTYINQIASYLKGKTDEGLWNDTLKLLRSKSHDDFLGLAGLDKFYEKVYETLSDDSVQKCLLYGALFPIEYNIYKDYLVECWIAEGFIVEPDEKLSSRRLRGETILNHLINTYLMEWCPGKKYVKMQPVFRRVALVHDCSKFVIWVPDEDQMPKRISDHDAGKKISMILSEKELPEVLERYNIYTLLLQKKANLIHLSENEFFDRMPNLQVLDLYKTDIEALPKSIRKLTSLKGLYLNGCTRLANLPPQAAKLVMLEFLDIRGTKMSSLPKEIGGMVALRCLRASLYTRISNSEGNEAVDPKALVPKNIIKKLKNLEELILDSDQIDDECWLKMADTLAPELNSLKCLTKSDFNFPNVRDRVTLDIIKRHTVRPEDGASYLMQAYSRILLSSGNILYKLTNYFTRK